MDRGETGKSLADAGLRCALVASEGVACTAEVQVQVAEVDQPYTVAASDGLFEQPFGAGRVTGFAAAFAEFAQGRAVADRGRLLVHRHRAGVVAAFVQQLGELIPGERIDSLLHGPAQIHLGPAQLAALPPVAAKRAKR